MDVNELFILVPALLGLKGNLEMTLASRLSTAVRRKNVIYKIVVDKINARQIRVPWTLQQQKNY